MKTYIRNKEINKSDCWVYSHHSWDTFLSVSGECHCINQTAECIHTSLLEQRWSFHEFYSFEKENVKEMALSELTFTCILNPKAHGSVRSDIWYILYVLEWILIISWAYTVWFTDILIELHDFEYHLQLKNGNKEHWWTQFSLNSHTSV